jgi:branched-chain amino acid transport system ATP-binding protein
MSSRSLHSLPTDAAPILALHEVEAAYEHIIVALRGVTLEVPTGSIVALLGPNGAGKSTTLKAASGLLAAERGAVTAGTITFAGHDVTRERPLALVSRGVVQVLEGRRCFPHLTVEENLLSGGINRGLGRSQQKRELERIYAYFPGLVARRRTPAGFTSGGEQQMIAIGRALIARPKLLLLDEPSMGLAPKIVESIFEIVSTLHEKEGVSVLLAEQNARLALRYAQWGYVLENGRVVAHGSARELSERDDVKDLYLGLGAQGVKRVRSTTSVRATER